MTGPLLKMCHHLTLTPLSHMSWYQSALLYFHGSAVSEICLSWISFHLRSIPNKKSPRPNYKERDKTVALWRTEKWDKIQKDLFPFVSWLMVAHIAPLTLFPFPSRSGELCDKLTLAQKGRGQITWCVGCYSTLHIPCGGWSRWLTGKNLPPPRCAQLQLLSIKCTNSGKTDSVIFYFTPLMGYISLYMFLYNLLLKLKIDV